MKGVVFTKLIEMMESNFGADMVDDVLDGCDLETDGAYTAVGTYDHNEMLSIVSELGRITHIPIGRLIFQFGHYFFGQFYTMMPAFFEEPQNSFQFLETINDHIHVEVRKLYPDAELPLILTQRDGPNTLIVTYKSKRPFSDFAEGLINGCIDFYKENVSIETRDQNKEDTYCRVFKLTREI